jgi:hypothetical protein
VILSSENPPSSADFLSSNGAEFLAPADASATGRLPAISPSSSPNFSVDIQELNGEKIG